MSIPPKRDAGKLRPVDVLCVKQGTVNLVRFLGGILGTEIHWVGGHSSPCIGEPECHLNHGKYPPMWRGFAPVIHWDDGAALWYARVLEVTAHLEELLRGHRLRGMEWAVVRPVRKDKQGAVMAEFMQALEPDSLPEPFDVQPVVRRLYQSDRIRWGIPNRIEPRIVLPSADAPAPARPSEEEKPMPPPITAEQREQLRNFLKGGQSPSSGPGPNGNGAAGKGGHHGH